MNSKYGEPFSIAHKDKYNEKFYMSKIPIAALCFNSRFSWNAGRCYQFLELEDCVCLYCSGENKIIAQHLVMPLGKTDTVKMKKIIDYYEPEFTDAGDPVKIIYVPDNKLEIFKNLEGYECEFSNSADFDEYVYETKNLRQLKGKSLKSKKNLLNRFFRDCTGCEFSELTKEHKDECLNLTEKWCEDRGIERDDLSSSDYIPIRLIFENFEKLNLRGGVIKLHKKMIGFYIGSEPVENTGFIHFEKVDHVISGSNVAIVVAALENSYSEEKYINREEDMGIEGLRTAKQSYSPAFMTRKYDVYLRKK